MISVVMTTYNAELFIDQAMHCLLAQTDPDFECIVVDDGSTDETVRMVQRFSDPRIRMIGAGRIGRGAALNLGIKESRGRYIAIQDADDLSHSRRLEIERAALDESKEFAAVGSGHLMFEGPEFTWKKDRDSGIENSFFDVSSSLLFRNPISHTSLMMRREVLEKVGGYDESRSDLFDWDLYIRLAIAKYRIGKFSSPLVAHRVHKGQFFEHMKRHRYVRHCYHLQREARKSLGGGIAMEAIFLAIYVYRLLPPVVRLRWKNVP